MPVPKVSGGGGESSLRSNISPTKDMFVDFRKQEVTSIKGQTVECVQISRDNYRPTIELGNKL